MASRGAALHIAIAILLAFGVERGATCSNVTAQSTQLDALLAEYDRSVPPAASLTVTLQLDLHHVTIVEADSTLRLLADLHMSWQDSRLSWNATAWGCEWALTSGERLWTPDVSVANAAASSSGEQPLSARLTSAGAVAWTTRLDVAVPIEMHLDLWPNDLQVGSVRFASRAHTIDEMDFEIKETESSRSFENGAWHLSMPTAGVLSKQESAVEGAGARRLVTWPLQLRRRAPSQVLGTRVALAVALLLLAAAALLPPANRAPLAAAAAFSAAIWLCGAAWRLGGSRDVPRAVCVQAAVCVVAGTLAVCAGLVQRVARLSAPPPHLVRNVVFSATRVLPLDLPPEGTGGESGPWVAAARVLDVVLLMVLTLTLLVLLCVYL